MLYNLIENLPIDLVGATVLQYLNIRDIVMLENACCSKASHQHFLNLIPRSPAITLSSSNHKDIACFEWFANRSCKIKYVTITLPGNNPALHVKNLQVENVDISLNADVTIDCCNHLFKSHLLCRVRTIKVFADQNKEVIEQLSLLNGTVVSLYVYISNNYHEWLSKDVLSRWKLKEIYLNRIDLNLVTITLIVQTCTELTSIKLNGKAVDDASVMAIAQHCPKLEKLNLPLHSKITYHSILALSKQGLPLKELGIPTIPNIPSADIAKRCSHALSCIRHLNTYGLRHNGQNVHIFLLYMTGLTSVILDNPSPSYIPLLTQYCHKLSKIHVLEDSYPVEEVLSLCHANPLLQELFSYASWDITDTILIELIHACPHLHTLYLSDETEITDIGILALSEHCPQLQLLGIQRCKTVTETAVLQLLQHCRKLTSFFVSEETWTQLDQNTQKRVSRW